MKVRKFGKKLDLGKVTVSNMNMEDMHSINGGVQAPVTILQHTCADCSIICSSPTYCIVNSQCTIENCEA